MEDATLSEADSIISRFKISQGRVGGMNNWSIFGDAITAYRLQYFVRQGKAYLERYRHTAMRIDYLFPLLLPSWIGGSQLRSGAGLLRWRTHRGRKSYPQAPEFGRFVIEKLNMNLRLDVSHLQQLARQIISERLDQPGIVPGTTLKLVDDLFMSISRQEKPLDENSAALVLRILNDQRIKTPSYTARVVKLARSRTADYQQKLARALFARLPQKPAAGGLEAMLPQVDKHLNRTGWAISALPEQAVKPYHAALERLARDRVTRVDARWALVQLAAFGKGAIPTLIHLIDDAHVLKTDTGRKSGNPRIWRAPYDLGMRGLCYLGDTGRQAIPMIVARVRSGVVRADNLTLQTLANLGAAPEVIGSLIDSHAEPRLRSNMHRILNDSGKISCPRRTF